MNVSADQAHALERLLTWVKKPTSESLRLGGYAGTGKTTLITLLRQEIETIKPHARVAFAAYTGKATHVLRSYLGASGSIKSQDRISTIHQLLYHPQLNHEGMIIGWKKSREIDADLIVIDEASMVTDHIWHDLQTYHIPIIAIGDHGQLPPINSRFSLMEHPDIVLEHIHRQARENPIIALAHQARETGYIPPGDYAKTVRKFSYATHDAYEIHDIMDDLLRDHQDDTLVLCGRNTTRLHLNRTIRQKADRPSDEPETGEKVVCLKNSYTQPGAPIYNGMIGTIAYLEPDEDHWYQATIDFADEEKTFQGRISRHQFHQPTLLDRVEGLALKDIGERFDFGYALTVHKAQGSQASTVLLFEERFQKSNDEDWKRWLYTAVTRARENLYIIAPQDGRTEV